MKYLLDTNVCIGYLNGRATGVLIRLQRTDPLDIAVCAVVKAELFYGAMKSRNVRQTLSAQRAFLDRFTSLPFDDAAASAYAELRAELEASGRPIGPYDLQIAAIALANDLTLVTRNTREFGRISGLRFEDWESS